MQIANVKINRKLINITLLIFATFFPYILEHKALNNFCYKTDMTHLSLAVLSAMTVNTFLQRMNGKILFSGLSTMAKKSAWCLAKWTNGTKTWKIKSNKYFVYGDRMQNIPLIKFQATWIICLLNCNDLPRRVT